MTKQIRLQQYVSGNLSVRFYRSLKRYNTYVIRRGSISEVRLQYILNKEFNLTDQYYNLNIESNVAYQLYYWLKRLS